MRAGESRASSRTKAQRAHVERQKQVGRYGRMAKPEQAPTRSWWLSDDFYGDAKKEAPRIMLRDRSVVRGEAT